MNSGQDYQSEGKNKGTRERTKNKKNKQTQKQCN